MTIHTKRKLICFCVYIILSGVIWVYWYMFIMLLFWIERVAAYKPSEYFWNSVRKKIICLICVRFMYTRVTLISLSFFFCYQKLQRLNLELLWPSQRTYHLLMTMLMSWKTWKHLYNNFIIMDALLFDLSFTKKKLSLIIYISILLQLTNFYKSRIAGFLKVLILVIRYVFGIVSAVSAV